LPVLDLEYRKLAAIMITDMAGYSDLSRRDEEGALRALDLYRRIVRDAVASHAGTEVKTMGDGFLLEFPSALDAVRCAVQIQHRLRDLNAQREPSEPIGVRIGVHLGEVIHKESDILGDGVNIAYRIEPLAEPGGIWLSEDVARQVESKVAWPLRRLGTAELTGPSILIGIYRVVLPWEASPEGDATSQVVKRSRWAAVGVVAACAILAVIAAALWVGQQQDRRGAGTADVGLGAPAQTAPSAPGPGTAAGPVAPRSADPAAEREYLAGRQVWADNPEAGGSREAAAHLVEATQKDPRFAEAWAALARCCALMGAYGQSAPSDAFPKARAAAEKALSLDPQSAEACIALALAQGCYEGNWQEAGATMQRALSLASGSAHVHDARAYWLALEGRAAESAAESAEAQRIDPVSRSLPLNACYLALATGGATAALDTAASSASKMPSSQPAVLLLARAQLAAGRPTEAAATLSRVAQDGSGDPMALVLWCLIHAQGPDASTVREALPRLEQAFGPQYISPAVVAACFAAVGDRSKAQAWLERARAERSVELLFPSTWPELAPLRADAALAPMLQLPAGRG